MGKHIFLTVFLKPSSIQQSFGFPINYHVFPTKIVLLYSFNAIFFMDLGLSKMTLRLSHESIGEATRI